MQEPNTTTNPEVEQGKQTPEEPTNVPITAETKLINTRKVETLNKASFKSSQEKNLRKRIVEEIPEIEQMLESLWPKKISIYVGKIKP